jgi:hypothetical protein
LSILFIVDLVSIASALAMSSRLVRLAATIASHVPRTAMEWT